MNPSLSSRRSPTVEGMHTRRKTSDEKQTVAGFQYFEEAATMRGMKMLCASVNKEFESSAVGAMSALLFFSDSFHGGRSLAANRPGPIVPSGWPTGNVTRRLSVLVLPEKLSKDERVLQALSKFTEQLFRRALRHLSSCIKAPHYARCRNVPVRHYQGLFQQRNQLSVVAASTRFRRFMHFGVQFRRQPQGSLDEIALIDGCSHASIIVPTVLSELPPLWRHGSMMPSCLHDGDSI